MNWNQPDFLEQWREEHNPSRPHNAAIKEGDRLRLKAGRYGCDPDIAVESPIIIAGEIEGYGTYACIEVAEVVEGEDFAGWVYYMDVEENLGQ